MSITDHDEVLHTIKVRLCAVNFPGAKGKYLARVSNEAMLTIEDVIAMGKNRGGFTGNYNDMVKHVRQFFGEMAYQLCDGFGVNLGYFSIQPSVGGTFTQYEDFDREKHAIEFSFHPRAPLRDLAGYIKVEVIGRGYVGGFIDRFTDINTGSVNGKITPGGMFSVIGGKIKVKGKHPDCGVYFVSTENPSTSFKVTDNLAENTAGKLIGVIPSLPAGEYTIEIKTQYTVGGIDLKEPRTVTGGFVLRV